jgi:flagellar biosynthesis chaperone FliJ
LGSKDKEVENLTLSLAEVQQRVKGALTEISELKTEKAELRTENKLLINEVSKLSNVRDKQLSDLIAKLDKPIDKAA